MEFNFSTEQVFNSAVNIIRNLPKDGSIRPSDEVKLKFYAYFKQATHGPNNTPKPRFYQIVEGYKWDAWHRLGDMTKEEAMLNYIDELKQAMDLVPEMDAESSNHFEGVLGKEFYDYWFNQWKQSPSDSSSVSLLGGYKTPTSIQYSAEMGDQIAKSILRLQVGLEGVTKRIEEVEKKMVLSKPKPELNLLFWLGYPFFVYLVMLAISRRTRTRE